MQNLFSAEESEEIEEILETFENDDYEAWKKITGENKAVTKIINKKKFEKFIQARQLARQGNYDQALKLTEQLKEEIKQAVETKKLV